jgi:hypothetical protein
MEFHVPAYAQCIKLPCALNLADTLALHNGDDTRFNPKRSQKSEGNTTPKQLRADVKKLLGGK